MDEITIIRLGPETKHHLDNVAEDVFDHPVRSDYVAAVLASPDHVMMLALAQGQVVGMGSAVFYYHPDKPRNMWINEVGTAEAWRRRGVATKIMQALLRAADEAGCQGVWLATEHDNAPARALYRHMDARESDGVVVYDWGDVE